MFKKVESSKRSKNTLNPIRNYVEQKISAANKVLD